MAEPFWKTFHASAPCPESYPQRKDGRSGPVHPKCCAGCPYPDTPCDRRLDCGATCFLPAGHEPPCLCIGDDNGEPDSCPA